MIELFIKEVQIASYNWEWCVSLSPNVGGRRGGATPAHALRVAQETYDLSRGATIHIAPKRDHG